MLWPPIKQHKISLLQIPVTCLGSISSRMIKFKNSSSVKSIIILDVLQSSYEERDVFWMTPTDDCETMVIRGYKGIVRIYPNMVTNVR